MPIQIISLPLKADIQILLLTSYPIFIQMLRILNYFNNTFTHLIVAESCFLSGFYMINTLRNKKIKKEQKPQMLINDTLTLGVSTAGAYLIEGKISKFVNNAAEKYFANHQDFYTKLGLKAQEALGNSPLCKR